MLKRECLDSYFLLSGTNIKKEKSLFSSSSTDRLLSLYESGMSRTRHLSFSAELEEASSSSSSLDFVTPQYDPSSLDQLNPADISLDDDEEYDETEEEESERYSRQRSRSRSFNEHDGDTPISIVTPVDLSTFSSQGTANAAPKKEETSSSSGERSGPLQQREVMALKKGLEEATLTRNQEELIEEEEESRNIQSIVRNSNATGENSYFR